MSLDKRIRLLERSMSISTPHTFGKRSVRLEAFDYQYFANRTGQVQVVKTNAISSAKANAPVSFDAVLKAVKKTAAIRALVLRTKGRDAQLRFARRYGYKLFFPSEQLAA